MTISKNQYSRKYKCESCQLVSSEVAECYRLKKKLCMECLREHMLDEVKNRQY